MSFWGSFISKRVFEGRRAFECLISIKSFWKYFFYRIRGENSCGENLLCKNSFERTYQLFFRYNEDQGLNSGSMKIWNLSFYKGKKCLMKTFSTFRTHKVQNFENSATFCAFWYYSYFLYLKGTNFNSKPQHMRNLKFLALSNRLLLMLYYFVHFKRSSRILMFIFCNFLYFSNIKQVKKL